MATYLLIGIIVGFVIGFWLRHQLEYLKIREDSIFNRKKNVTTPDEKPTEKIVIPVRKDRFSRHITKQHSGMDEPK